MAALQAVCPALAAAFLVCHREGTSALRALLTRSADYDRVRPKRWYLVILLLMPALGVLSYWLLRAMQVSLPPARFPVGPALGMFLGFVVMGVAEEIGWTGYALLPLRARWGPLAAAVAIGIVWAGWHVPALRQAGRPGEWIAWWALGTLATRVIIVRLYEVAGPSVFAAGVYHATDNLCWQLFPDRGSHYDPRITSLLILAAAVALQLTRFPHRSSLRQAPVRDSSRIV